MHEDPLCEVGCPYAVRGFDFDYIGLLWLSDLVWRNGNWEINPDDIFETGFSRKLAELKNETTPNGPAYIALLHAVQEAYRILLTRPMKGLYIWCEDMETRDLLESTFLDKNKS